MSKFKKKPVVIEAFQMTPETRIDNSNWPHWMNEAWNKNNDDDGSLVPSEFPNSPGNDKLMINTLEGKMLVEWNDWIIQGVKGEIYPCKPDIFDATYEPVD